MVKRGDVVTAAFKIASVRKDKLRRVIGRLDDDTIIRVNRSLAFRLGLG